MSRENLFAMPWRENEGWNPTFRTDQLSSERTDTALSLVLIDCNIIVVIDGVAHDEESSDVVTGREVIDDGGTLVENHVETHTVLLHLLRFCSLFYF